MWLFPSRDTTPTPTPTPAPTPGPVFVCLISQKMERVALQRVPV